MSVAALDIGTSRMKAVLASWTGGITAVRSVPTPVLSEAAGHLAFPADEVLAAASALLEGLARAHPDDPVDTVVFSCLGTAMVPVDREGCPLGPALAPGDIRPSKAPGLMDRVALPADALLDITGQDPRTPSFLLHWLWWRETHPEVMRRVHRFRSLRGFIVERLCGADAEDPSWASRTMLMDLATSTWSRQILVAADLPEAALPSIRPSTAWWPVRPAAAAELGLSPGVRVVQGGMDNCCAFLGASDPDEQRLVNIAGTYEHLAGVGDLDATSSAAAAVGGLTHRYLLADRYLSYSRVPLGHLLAQVDAAAPGGLGRLMDAVAEVPTGVSTRLDGEAVRTVIATGGPPGEVLQGLLEASAAVLGRYADAWVAAGGSVDRIVTVGGGAAHARALQLKANLLGRPVSTLASDEASGIGALRLAAIAVLGSSPTEASILFPNPVALTWRPIDTITTWTP
ncbi:MAG TPA: FGGY family carbohydrate kinase [Candidatus Limnocylindrales bacterium]|nr:FGGY family carbohydrate kinase [Candidatus Limnocylindrales bacterium]